MKILFRPLRVLAALAIQAGASPALAQSSEKARLIVLTDIGNEPDDSMSMVRLLTYANELDIEGLIATTSTHLRTRTHREMIEHRVRAYGQALPNLRVHSPGYPDEAELMGKVRAGCAAYGMACVGKGKDTEASRLIISAVDRPDPRPVWVAIWGGGADLAQALWSVRATRSPAQVARFVSKLRVYSISDQDDSEPWARAMFPKLFWIASVHAFGDYNLASWAGITAPAPGVDSSQVSQPWIDANIRNRGPLGALYPRIVFGMEGDTPSFLYLIPNGLGSSEHPDWGSWGGRYGQPDKAWGLWASATDRFTGGDGQMVFSSQGTVSRWRTAFQNDFAARMDWSVQKQFSGANHPPQVRLNGAGGLAPVAFTLCAGETVRLNAAGTTDPDGNSVTYRWWQYREPGAQPLAVEFGSPDGAETTAVVPQWAQMTNQPMLPSYQAHIVLEVTDNGKPALVRYRRAVLNVLTGGQNGGRACPAPRPLKPHDFSDEATPAAAPGVLTTATASLGDLLDNPAARAVLGRHVPELVQGGAVNQALGMTLRILQAYMPSLTDAALNAIDADLAKIPR